jgi:pimeloyl-ACP methyl ester carboxylesterase
MLCLTLLLGGPPVVPPGQDRSPHAVRFVTVEKNVRLETLDWGGTGRPVILLAGGGNTAHVYDDFAPKLGPEYHVYGITRRGFGRSRIAGSRERYSLDRLRDDILAVIDSLKLNRPVLVGHSFAGAELSAVAGGRPDRIAGLVYLDAGYPYAFDNGTGPASNEFPPVREIPFPTYPTPGDSDQVSFRTLRAWSARVDGFRIPEGEWRQLWDSTADGRVIKARDFPGSASLLPILANPRKVRDLPVPALVIFALPHVPEAYVTTATDPSVRAVANRYLRTVDDLTERQAKSIEAGARTARVIRLRGHHYVFLTSEADVLREMRTFLRALK